MDRRLVEVAQLSVDLLSNFRAKTLLHYNKISPNRLLTFVGLDLFLSVVPTTALYLRCLLIQERIEKSHQI